MTQLQTELAKNVAIRNQNEEKVRAAARDVARAARRIDHLHRALRHDESELHTLEQRQRALTNEISNQRTQLARQLRATYQTGGLNYMKVLLNQQDPAKLGRVLTYYNYYNAHRIGQVTRLQTEIQEAHGLERAILQRKDAIARRLTELQTERMTLNRQLEHRQQLLVKMNNQVRAQGQELGQIREDGAQLERLLASLKEALAVNPPTEPAPATARAPGKGHLHWPVQGQVQAEFGRPRNAGGLKWSGVFIAAPEGTPVRSVASGHIVFADWMPGYGLVLIIDHSHGILTLYGYNQTLVKEVGDHVEADETVATVGRGTATETTGLYFEVRNDGKPTDPRRWLAARGP